LSNLNKKGEAMQEAPWDAASEAVRYAIEDLKRTLNMSILIVAAGVALGVAYKIAR